MNKKLVYLLIGGAMTLTGCSKHGWSVEGVVHNAPEGAKIAVEGFNAGIWYNIDSVTIGSNGHFEYTSPEGSPYPDIYRVSLDGKSIYFPIDSLESISINTDASAFDKDYTLKGWIAAEQMMDIDKLISSVVSEKGNTAALTDSLLKRQLNEVLNNDESGILGYYIINKTIGGQPLYKSTDRGDLRIMGAIANKFNTLYPNDPRTEYLCRQFILGRAALNPETLPSRTIEANEAGMFEVNLYDANGQKQSLEELAKKSSLTVLNFTAYEVDGSLAYNVELNNLYEKFKPQNIAIYQVSLDSDEVQWRASAKNLPWTAVWYDRKDGGTILANYNVSVLPTTYIIDSNGDLVDRVDDVANLESTVRKHIK